MNQKSRRTQKVAFQFHSHVMDDHQAQTRSRQFFILGAQGAAAEVARHLLAAGQSVTLSDADSLVSADLAACPLFRTYDVGYRRDIILFQQFQRLGTPGTIDYLDATDLSDLNEYDIIIYSNSSQFSVARVQAYCREREIPFILVQTLGLCGRVFVNRGASFCYFHPGAGTLALRSGQHHTLSEFAQLPLSERAALTEVIAEKPGQNADCLQHIFKLMDSGIVDVTRYKTPWNAKAALDLFTQFGFSSPTAFQDDKYQRVASIFAGCAHFQFYPVNLAVGALGALEALRVFDCRFGFSSRQQMIVDYTNVLPALPLESEARPRGTRYDGLIALFGIGTANRLLNQKVAVVASTRVAEELGKAVALCGSCSRTPLYLHELVDATA